MMRRPIVSPMVAPGIGSKVRMPALLTAVAGILSTAVWLWTTLTPGDDMVRLRNSFGAQVGVPADFSWDPDSPPESFLSMKGTVPVAFDTEARRVREILGGGNRGSTEFGLAVARELMNAPKRTDGAINKPSYETYEAIAKDGKGYCGDFVKAFNALALAQEVPVRQWGFAFSGFGSGHTFNEVYDDERQKWVMIDSFHSLYFVDPDTRVPLSTLEVHDRLLNIDGEVRGVDLIRIVPERVPFRSDALATDYYRRGMSQLWLVWGNNIFDYEASLPGKIESVMHRAVGQFFGILTGRYPTLRIYPSGASRRDVNALFEGRNEFLLAASAFLCSILFGGWLIIRVCQRA